MPDKTIEDLRNTLIGFKNDIDNIFDEKIYHYSKQIYKFIPNENNISVFDMLLNKKKINAVNNNIKQNVNNIKTTLQYLKNTKNKINNILLDIIKESNCEMNIDSDKSYTNLLLALNNFKKYIINNKFKLFENKIISVKNYLISLKIKYNNIVIKTQSKKIIDIYPEMEELMSFLNTEQDDRKNNSIPLLLPFDFVNKKYNTIMNFDDIFYEEKIITGNFNKERFTSNAFLDITKTSFETYEKLKSIIPLIFYDKKNEDFEKIFGFSKECLIQDKIFLNKNLHSNIIKSVIINNSDANNKEIKILKKGLLWNNISKSISFKNGYRCSGCGAVTYTKTQKINNPDTHEIWKLDIDENNKHINKTLKNIISLCRCCHSTIHCDHRNQKEHKTTLLGYMILDNIPLKEEAYNEGILQKQKSREIQNENEYTLTVNADIVENFDIIKNILRKTDINYNIQSNNKIDDVNNAKFIF